MKAPPRLNPRLRLAVGAGLACVATGPWLVYLAAYWDGRSGRYLFFSIWTLLALAVIGLTTLATLACSQTLFNTGERKFKWWLFSLLLLGGPVWYFTMTEPPGIAVSRGAADAARAAFHVPSLQAWAAHILKETSASKAKPPQERIVAEIGWERAPQDVRAFLGPDGTARVEQDSEGERFIRLYKSPLMLHVGGRDAVPLEAAAKVDGRAIAGKAQDQAAKPRKERYANENLPRLVWSRRPVSGFFS